MAIFNSYVSLPEGNRDFCSKDTGFWSKRPPPGRNAGSRYETTSGLIRGCSGCKFDDFGMINLSWDSTVIFWLSKKETPMSSNPNISHEFPWNTFWDTPWNCIGFFFLDYVLYSTVWTFSHMRKSTGIPLWNGILQWINHGRRWSRRNAHDHHRLRDLCSSWSSCLLSDEVVFACIFVGFASSKIV